MVLLDRDGWTVVTRRRRWPTRDTAGPRPRLDHSRTRQAQGLRSFSYADAVKFGRHTRAAPTHRINESHHWHNRPQFFDSRARSGPYTPLFGQNAPTRTPRNRGHNQKRAIRPNLQEKNKKTHHEQNTMPIQFDDPDFMAKTMCLFNIIKLIHHQNNVSQEQPPTIKGIEEHLSEVIKPALSNPQARALIEGNAKNWAYTTMLILRNHYEDTLVEEVAKLQNFPSQGRDECFDTAILWAKRAIGRRLKDKSVHEAYTLVEEKWQTAAPSEIGGEVETQRVSPSPLPEHTMGGNVTLQALVHHESNTQSFPLISTQPVTKLTKSASTMTDPPIDWSPFREENLDHNPISTVALPPSPKEQRTPQLRPNPCVRTEEVLLSSEDEEEYEQGNAVSSQRVTLSPDKVSSLRTASQARLCLEPNTLSGVQCDSQEDGPNRHINTPRKMMEWKLTVRKKWLIVGDSNLSRIPPFKIPDLQIESYPGATFRHMEAVISKITASTEVEHVILALGINSRLQNAKDTAIKQMQGALRAAKEKFPLAQIWVPELNFSGMLPTREQTQLTILNSHITANLRHIPALARYEFHTESDNIHWTLDTARRMLQHWLQHLK